jgi:hypothetical protein
VKSERLRSLMQHFALVRAEHNWVELLLGGIRE